MINLKDKNKIDELKSSYSSIEISNRLDDVVNDALNINNKKTSKKNIYKWPTIVASVLILGIINFNPTIANALEGIPVIGEVIKVINLKNYKIDKNGFDISIDVPKIEGLRNKELEYEMNKEFEEEGKRLYEEYVNEMKELEKEGVEGRELFKSWYEVKTNNNDILSIIVYNYYAQGSSNTTTKIYNIDKKNDTVLTLEGMFNGDSYINVISENIKEQMRTRMKEDSGQTYWIDQEDGFFEFDKIDKNQDFYINDNGDIVICFDKYDVAPGSQGLVEFEIPNEVIEKLMN